MLILKKNAHSCNRNRVTQTPSTTVQCQTVTVKKKKKEPTKTLVHGLLGSTTKLPEVQEASKI